MNNFFKKCIIELSPLKNLYTNLTLNNCIHDIKDNKLDSYYINLIYKLIIYGNIKSQCKKMSLHTRFHNIDDVEKHQIASECDMIIRKRFNYDTYLFVLLFVILIQSLTKIEYTLF